MTTTGERELTDAECDEIVADWAGKAYGRGLYRALIRAGWQAAIAAQPAQDYPPADDWDECYPAAQPERAREPVAQGEAPIFRNDFP